VTIIKCLIFSQPISGKYRFLITANVSYMKSSAENKRLLFGLYTSRIFKFYYLSFLLEIVKFKNLATFQRCPSLRVSKGLRYFLYTLFYTVFYSAGNLNRPLINSHSFFSRLNTKRISGLYPSVPPQFSKNSAFLNFNPLLK
jgi:hypothetical protein